MSYCCASSASVLSLFSAASATCATCALNAGAWFRLVLLVMLSLLLRLLPQPFKWGQDYHVPCCAKFRRHIFFA